MWITKESRRIDSLNPKILAGSFHDPSVMLGFQIFSVDLFFTRMRCGYILGCKYAPLCLFFFNFFFENIKNATVYVVWASAGCVVTINSLRPSDAYMRR